MMALPIGSTGLVLCAKGHKLTFEGGWTIQTCEGVSKAIIQRLSGVVRT